MRLQRSSALALFATLLVVNLPSSESQSLLRRRDQTATCYSISPSVPDSWCPPNNCPADSCAPGTAPAPILNCKATGGWKDEWCQTHGCPSAYCATTTGTTTTPAPTNAPVVATPSPTKVPTSAPAPTTAPAPGTTKSPTRKPTKRPTKKPTKSPTRKPTASTATPAPTSAPPTSGSCTYTVKSGDTCDPIAASHGITTAQLLQLNPSINAQCTNLQIGQVLQVCPSSTSPSAPTTSLTLAPTASGPAPAPAPVPSPPTGTAVYFSPYDDISLNTRWSNTVNDLIPEDLVAIADKSGIKRFTAAFITAAGSGCTPAWAGSTSYPATGTKPWGLSVFQAFKASGRTYTISFGGAAGTDLCVPCDVNGLISIYQQVIDIYAPERLDFDIEGGLLTNTAAIGKMVTALKTTQAKNPNVKLSFTLPVMPYGFDQAMKDMINQAIAAGLTFQVSVMTMDYGDGYSGNQATNAMNAGDNVVSFLKTVYPSKTTAQLYAMVILCQMIGVNDVVSNVFYLADADTLNAYAKSKGLGGLSMWSLNRDHPCASTSVSATCSSGNVQTTDYEFAKRLGA